jgi:DNA mismatch repair protein MutS2
MDSGEFFPIGTFEDIRGYLQLATVEGSYLEPDALRHIHQVLDVTATLHGFFSQNRSYFPLLQKVGSSLVPNRPLVQEVVKAVDLKTLEIRDQASTSLATIRRKMSQARERVRKELETTQDRLWRKGVLQERLITMRQGRWVLPVKETHRHLIKGVLHDQSASGATLFVEPIETLELNNKVRRLEADERLEVEKVLRQLTDLVRVSCAELEQNLAVLIVLDCVHAMALTSSVFQQHEPSVQNRGLLKIQGGRHPLLALRQDMESPAVPLDLSIGEGFNTLVITGPNAGGKTVALKTVGLLALMVSCGLHVPADADSEIPLFNQIFAHVGDAQSIEMDLSTFSAHLKGINEIVDTANAQALVLIDEIGSGTDPQEGAALAMSVLEALTSRGALTIVTTHQGTLKAFAHETPGIANGSMAFDTETLTPTYKFRPHLPGSSYAFEIAKRMGLTDTIITRSRSLMGSQAHRLEDLILQLQDQIQRNEQLETDLEAQAAILQDLAKRYRQKRDVLEQETKHLRRQAAEAAKELIREANAAVEKAIQTVREQGATRQAIQDAKALIRQEKETIDRELKATLPGKRLDQGHPIKDRVTTGDRVHWMRGGVDATVLSEEDTTGEILIASGNLKVRVPKEELTRTKDLGKTPSDFHSHVAIPFPDKVHTEIDIRGMQVDEALEAVDRFLNDALLGGLREAHVIHGVGTGALRNSVVPFLKEHPLVQVTLPGGPNQNNPGMTTAIITGK